jgi:hypothetical protein
MQFIFMTTARAEEALEIHSGFVFRVSAFFFFLEIKEA